MARFGAACLAPLVPCLALLFGVTGARGAYVIPGAERDDCSQQGMNCSFSPSNCLDPAWVISHRYTPSGPDQLDLRISTRRDPDGNLLPVINASWTLKDDGVRGCAGSLCFWLPGPIATGQAQCFPTSILQSGRLVFRLAWTPAGQRTNKRSIGYLKASELQVVMVSTNQNICVRYSFNNMLEMRSPTEDKWTLRSDVLVVDPGQMYRVSVENIPKHELGHSASSISRDVSVPDCSDPEMKRTQPCIESGVLWRPNISLSHSGGTVLTVEFSPDPLSEQYLVLCRCDLERNSSWRTLSANGSRLSVSFPLDQWSRACCRFHVEIKPSFSHCGDDCRRTRRTLDICSEQPPAPPADPWSPLPVALGISSVLILSVAIGVCIAIVCRRGVARVERDPDKGTLLQEHRLEEHPTLLLIYSRDHPLFLDVVLKLAAFLQAHCGILVLLDLLDSSAVSQVGLMRWLELQRDRLRPNGKILVLCSRGVQSKWRAMCGQGHVTHQPDDLIGPFLSLFLSDMHQPGSMGRYIAAHFEEISSEREVPSFFDIAVKYKLMKHFEELYFRVLDREKYEPRKVNRIEGIGPDEYFRCPSGRRLRNAIEKFHAFQIDNPDWFEKGETEDVDHLGSVIVHTQRLPQILERIPIVNEGPAIFTNEVSANENMSNFYTIAPELNRNLSISENEPILNAASASQNQPVLELQPDLWPSLAIFQSDVIAVTPTEDQQVAGASARQGGESVAGLSFWKPQPVEMAEAGAGETSGSDQAAVAGASVGRSEAGAAGFPWSKADTSGSDQGYSSRAWTEPDSDDLRALMLLQEELMNNTSHYDAQ